MIHNWKNQLYRVNKAGTIEFNEQVLNLLPSLRKVPQDVLEYIVLAYDYLYSPVKMRPIKERKIYASRKVWGNIKILPEEDERYKTVMDKWISDFKMCIYDDRIETVEACRTKIAFLNKELSDPAQVDSRKMADIGKGIDVLQKRIDNLEEEIIEEEEKMELQGDKKESYIEKIRRNKKLYEIKGMK